MNTLFRTSIALLVTSGAIKTWIPGENITTTDLNAALQHIHTKMVGGHGARLVDADVSASAAISTSKLAARYYIPSGYFTMTAACAAGTCAVTKLGNISSVTWGNTGRYDVAFTAARVDNDYVVNCTVTLDTGAPTVYSYIAYTASKATTGFSVQVFGGAGAADINGMVDCSVYDDN